MATTRLLVCEQTGRWAVALRRTLAARPVRIYEIRSLADCRREIAINPASFALVEATPANVAKVVEWIEQIGREFPETRMAVVGSREAQPYEWAMREAGAIATVFSPRRLGPLVRMAWRHLAHAPEEETGFREQVAKRLPWKGRATGDWKLGIGE